MKCEHKLFAHTFEWKQFERFIWTTHKQNLGTLVHLTGVNLFYQSGSKMELNERKKSANFFIHIFISNFVLRRKNHQLISWNAFLDVLYWKKNCYLKNSNFFDCEHFVWINSHFAGFSTTQFYFRDRLVKKNPVWGSKVPRFCLRVELNECLLMVWRKKHTHTHQTSANLTLLTNNNKTAKCIVCEIINVF